MHVCQYAVDITDICRQLCILLCVLLSLFSCTHPRNTYCHACKAVLSHEHETLHLTLVMMEGLKGKSCVVFGTHAFLSSHYKIDHDVIVASSVQIAYTHLSL